jgi:hypothetical protein
LKRLTREQEKIFVFYIFAKELIQNINFLNINDPMKKVANELNRAFTKEEVQITTKKTKPNQTKTKQKNT